MKTTRKNFLKKTSSILLGISIIPSLKNLYADNEIDLFFKSFPENLPKTKRIEKFHIPDSKYCLVHIREIHYKKSKEQSQGLLNEVYIIQKDIYEILNFLIDNHNLKSVRPEGLTNDKRNKTIKQRARIYYEKIKRRTGREYIGGAVKKLILEDRLNAKPAEIFETRKKMNEMKEKIKEKIDFTEEEYQVFRKHAMEKREDDLLKLITNDLEKISFTVYGGAHAWGGKKSCGENYILKNKDSTKDNIYEWNKKHQDKKFSLIEITPESYREFL